MTDERYEELVVRAVDGLASATEKDELMTYLVDHPRRRQDYESQLALKALTDGWVARLEQDVLRDHLQEAPAQKIGKWSGQLLVIVSLLLLTGGGVYEMSMDAEVPLWLKLGVGLGVVGSAVLLAATARARHAVEDPYSKVIR